MYLTIIYQDYVSQRGTFNIVKSSLKKLKKWSLGEKLISELPHPTPVPPAPFLPPSVATEMLYAIDIPRKWFEDGTLRLFTFYPTSIVYFCFSNTLNGVYLLNITFVKRGPYWNTEIIRQQHMFAFENIVVNAVLVACSSNYLQQNI